jgi:hypothetical protein
MWSRKKATQNRKKMRLAQLKGGFSVVTQNLEPTKKNTKRNGFFVLLVEGMTNNGNCCSGGNLPTTTIQAIEKNTQTSTRKG